MGEVKNKTDKPKIRKASIKDINLIIDVQKRDGFAHAYYLNRRRLKELFKRGEIFFIAFLNNKAVGFVSLRVEIRAKLHFISVVKELTKKGIGSLLMQKVISETKRRGKNMVYVYTEANSPVEQFFIRKGFKKVGYFRNRFGGGKHANIFSLYL